MIIHKRLTIGGKPCAFDDDVIALHLFTPGSASFVINSAIETSGLVVFSMGYKKDALSTYFIGYVEGEPNRVDNNHKIIYCRELTALLRAVMPLALRKCSLIDVLKAINVRTKLVFSTATQAGYAQHLAPYFYSLGNGYHCMDSMADIYAIDRFIWQQQGDGGVFVGSWYDSFWSGRSVPVFDKLLSAHKMGGKMNIPVSEKVRPGLAIAERGIIESLTLKSDEMAITVSSDPWKNR